MKKILNISAILKGITLLLLTSLLLGYLAPLVHPADFWVLPFFGLTYPITLLMTLILLLIWVLKRSKWSFYVAIVLLVGLFYHFRLVGLTSSQKALPKGNNFKIVSNNIQIFDVYNEDTTAKYANRKEVCNYLQEQDADVVCLQEFYTRGKPFDFQNIDFLQEKLETPYHHKRLHFTKRGKQYFGVILFSKYPIISRGDVNFENTILPNYNFCIYADIVKENDTIRVYNAHLQSIKFSGGEKYEKYESQAEKWVDKLRIAYPKRADQAEGIAKHIASSPYPVVICGDFNDTPISYVYNTFNASLNDAFLSAGFGLGSTFVGKVPAGRIDYFFHDNAFSVANFSIQKKPTSDHRAISCNFTLQK